MWLPASCLQYYYICGRSYAVFQLTRVAGVAIPEAKVQILCARRRPGLKELLASATAWPSCLANIQPALANVSFTATAGVPTIVASVCRVESRVVLLVPRPSERPISADFRSSSEGALLDLLAVGSAAQPGSTQLMRVVELKAVVSGIALHC
jgi:hypothetical protein